jgi:septal ring factor EnvC (AmiA/AmiB activator)
LFLLEFPRTVNDGDYLIETLWPWLSSHCERERAAAAFSAVADPQLVRIKEETGVELSANGSHDASALDRDAMAIVLKERDSVIASMEDQLAEVREVLANTDRELTEVRKSLVTREDAVARTELQLDGTRAELASLQRQLVAVHEDLAGRNADIEEMQAQLQVAAAEAEAVRRTVSWRITRPIRMLRSGLR